MPFRASILQTAGWVKNDSNDRESTVLPKLKSDGDTMYTEKSVTFPLPERRKTGDVPPSNLTRVDRSHPMVETVQKSTVRKHVIFILVHRIS
jgi:hypothetical protein